MFDFSKPANSPCKWNPLWAIYWLLKSINENDKEKGSALLNTLINTLYRFAENDDWGIYTKELMKGVIYLLTENANPKEMNFTSVSSLLKEIEDLKGIFDDTDLLFELLSTGDLAKAILTGYLNGARGTRHSTQIIAARGLEPFHISEGMMYWLSQDTMNLHNLDVTRPFFISVIMPEGSKDIAGLVNLFASQIMALLDFSAEESDSQKLPLRCNVILDSGPFLKETFSDLPEWLSTKRKHNIRFMLVLQDDAELNSYEESRANNIKGNCGITICFRSHNLDLLKEMSIRAGYNISRNELITIQELESLEDGTALVMIRGRYKFITTLEPCLWLSLDEKAKSAPNVKQNYPKIQVINFHRILKDKLDAFCNEYSENGCYNSSFSSDASPRSHSDLYSENKCNPNTIDTENINDDDSWKEIFSKSLNDVFEKLEMKQSDCFDIETKKDFDLDAEPIIISVYSVPGLSSTHMAEIVEAIQNVVDIDNDAVLKYLKGDNYQMPMKIVTASKKEAIELAEKIKHAGGQIDIKPCE